MRVKRWHLGEGNHHLIGWWSCYEGHAKSLGDGESQVCGDETSLILNQILVKTLLK